MYVNKENNINIFRVCYIVNVAVGDIYCLSVISDKVLWWFKQLQLEVKIQEKDWVAASFQLEVFLLWQGIIVFDLNTSSSSSCSSLLVRSWLWCSPCWCTVKFCVLRSTWTDCRPADHWPTMERLITQLLLGSQYTPQSWSALSKCPIQTVMLQCLLWVQTWNGCLSNALRHWLQILLKRFSKKQSNQNSVGTIDIGDTDKASQIKIISWWRCIMSDQEAFILPQVSMSLQTKQVTVTWIHCSCRGETLGPVWP